MSNLLCRLLPLGVVTLLPLLAANAQETERRWDLQFGGFFSKGANPICVYARERNGQWIAGVGSSRIPGTTKYSLNKSYHWVDMSKTPITNGVVKGPVRVHITPDLWVPSKHIGFTVDLELDATVKADGTLAGNYAVVKLNTTDPTAENLGKGGTLSGTSKPYTPPPLPDPVTFTLNMQGALVGGKPEYGERCLVLRLGFQGKKLASGISGALSQKGDVHSTAGFPVQPDTATYDADSIKGKVVVATKTLDMAPCEYTVEFDGRIMESFAVGAFKETVKVEGGETITRESCFDGKWAEGIQVMAEADTRPWWQPVKGFQPVQPGEHPRLLFRRTDLPALKKKAETPEGKAILASLRRALNGKDGETMPTVYNSADKAYDDDGNKRMPMGGYTISHVAGFGLLYQLTGDKKYAEFGKQCFEKALAGQRDRDDRYSFRAPGGALRAGPSLGWYAVGYDLCYDGWDQATREKFGKAIENYNEGEATRDAKGKINLEALVRGTMTPGSNHFGMQVGGAALALMAVMHDPFVDQKRIDGFLKISENSMMRNMTEGFGDGGFFAEGDGTGSMSSQIAFVSALRAWGHALGRDYFNVERPNARMMTLKWVYLTVVRSGQPDFWPIRGEYGHNVWSRRGLSGGGYFGMGLGSVADDQKAALKWYYDHFLLENDKGMGGPYDTVSPYPHYVISSFVNWPVDLEAKNPAEVLPLCYRDSKFSFYAWRNRWQDEHDVVMSVLTKTTTGGNYKANMDKGLQVAAFGRKFTWVPLTGDVKRWWTSPRGETSVLTMADGTGLAVDFTKASGADAMLVTTAKTEGQQVKLGNAALTFKFLTAGEPPAVRVEGANAVVGKQTVSVKDGSIVLAVTAAP